MKKKNVDIRDQRNGDWYWISRMVYQRYITKIGVVGLALYNAYASYSYDEQKVFPSQTTIAEKLNITIPTLIKYDKLLIKYRLISIKKQKGKVNIVTLLKVRRLKEIKATPKPPLGVPLNLLKANNNKDNKNKEKLGKSAKRAKKLISSKELELSFNNRCAKRLSTLINKKGRISRKVGEKRWAREIRLLRTLQNIEKARIKKVIKWLVLFIDDEYTPKIYKVVDFREKFLRIEDAMSRVNKNIEDGQQKTKYKVRKK